MHLTQRCGSSSNADVACISVQMRACSAELGMYLMINAVHVDADVPWVPNTVWS